MGRAWPCVLRSFVVVATLVSLGGCAKLSQSKLVKDVSVLMGPAPKVNETPMQVPLACLAQMNVGKDIRVGVADFVDASGVMEGGTTNSRAFSQRADMMMVVALARGGAHLVNRNATNVSEWELKNAIEKKLGDGHPVVSDNQSVEFRPVRMGSMLGSTHFVSGAITELNWNISSSVGELGAYSLSFGKRTYRISIAIDVMVTDTITTEVVHARSYKKQLVGFETSAGFFRFLSAPSASSLVGLSDSAIKGLEVFNSNLGEKQNEPQQAALRWLIELSAYDMLRSLSGGGGKCDQLLPPGSLVVKNARPSTRPGSPPPVPNGAMPTPRTAPGVADPAGEPEAANHGVTSVGPAVASGAGAAQPGNDRSSLIVVANVASETEAARLAIKMQGDLAAQLSARKLQILPRPAGGGVTYFVGVTGLEAREASILCFRIKVAGGACDVGKEQTTAGQPNPAPGGRASIAPRDDAVRKFADVENGPAGNGAATRSLAA